MPRTITKNPPQKKPDSLTELIQLGVANPFQRSWNYTNRPLPQENIKETIALVGMAHSAKDLDTLFEVNHSIPGSVIHPCPTDPDHIFDILELWAYRLRNDRRIAQDLIRKMRLYSNLRSGILSPNYYGLPWNIEFSGEPHYGDPEPFPLPAPHVWTNQEVANLIFSECSTLFSSHLAEYTFEKGNIFFKLEKKALEEPLLNKSIEKLMRTLSIKKDNTPPDDDSPTECHILRGSKNSYFAKRLTPYKVPYSDYELGIASEIIKKGICTPNPVGIIISKQIPYLIFEYCERAINLFGFDSSYTKPEELFTLLQEQTADIYTELGRAVKRILDRGILPKDIAKRNFMAQFDSSGKFQKIILVDFERTSILNLQRIDYILTIERLRRELSPMEERHFIAGYNSADSKYDCGNNRET